MADRDDVTWVRTPGELAALACRLRRSRAFGIDSESDSLWHFREKVCLIQIGTPEGDVFLVDPFEVRDLSPLSEVVSDPGVEKAIHGADYDVAVLKRDFGFHFENLLDTMLAARFLGYDQVGLAAVVEREFGTRLSKGPRTADWSRRPIDPALVRYGAADARHLVPLRDRLVERLAAAGREAWVREECAQVAAAPAATARPAPADWRRAAGARDLDGPGQAVLCALFELREQVAERLDWPRFRVAGDDVLVEMARRRPPEAAALAGIRGLPGSIARRPDEWLDAIRRALETGPLPAAEAAPARRRLSPDVSARIGRLRAWRDRAAAALRLDPGLLLPQRLVVAIALGNPTDQEALSAVPGIRRWRVEAFGDRIIAAMRR